MNDNIGSPSSFSLPLTVDPTTSLYLYFHLSSMRVGTEWISCLLYVSPCLLTVDI